MAWRAQCACVPCKKCTFSNTIHSGHIVHMYESHRRRGRQRSTRQRQTTTTRSYALAVRDKKHTGDWDNVFSLYIQWNCKRARLPIQKEIYSITKAEHGHISCDAVFFVAGIFIFFCLFIQFSTAIVRNVKNIMIGMCGDQIGFRSLPLH